MQLKVEELTNEKFSPFGSYFNIYDVDVDKNGDFAYYPDVTAALFGSNSLTGFSVCGINKRQMRVEVVEMHEHTEEVEFNMSCDSVILVGEKSGCKPELSKFKAFIVPRGTLVRFKRCVWHFVPFPVEDIRAIVMTVLPPFTYTNDSIVAQLEEAIEIEH